MKKLTLKVVTSIALLASGFISANASHHGEKSDYSKIDVEKVCNVKSNGISIVIETAKKYNAIAIKDGLEFRRLGVNNSGLIASVEEAIKTKAKEVNPKDFKGKTSKTKLETNFAAHRSCKFAIRALQQAQEAKSTWRLAIPGDGYSY